MKILSHLSSVNRPAGGVRYRQKRKSCRSCRIAPARTWQMSRIALDDELIAFKRFVETISMPKPDSPL